MCIRDSASSEEVEEIKKVITIYTTTRPRRRKRKIKEGGEFGKGGRGFLSGFEFLNVFRVHRLGLRFDVPEKCVNVTALYELPGIVSYEPQNKQHVVKLGLGFRRVVTIQVNRDGSAQFYLECSDNPMDFFEFVGFCKFWLLETFSKLTGAVVSLKDFRVIVSPEYNADFPGLRVVAEGRSTVTLEDLYNRLIARVYGVGDGEKLSMPEGGVRLEASDKSVEGADLETLVEGAMAVAVLPRELQEMKKSLKTLRKDVELLKGGLTSIQIFNERLQNLEAAVRRMDQTLGDYLANKLGNLWYATFERFRDSLVEGIREGLKQAMRDAIKEAVGEIRREVEVAGKRVTFRDLPEDLQWALKELERFGYVRIREDRVEYGDRVWSAIRRYHGNIDGWIEWEAQGWVGKMRGVFKDIIGTIRYFDNKYEGKPGVPYDKFLEAFKLSHRKRKQSIDVMPFFDNRLG